MAEFFKDTGELEAWMTRQRIARKPDDTPVPDAVARVLAEYGIPTSSAWDDVCTLAAALAAREAEIRRMREGIEDLRTVAARAPVTHLSPEHVTPWQQWFDDYKATMERTDALVTGETITLRSQLAAREQEVAEMRAQRDTRMEMLADWDTKLGRVQDENASLRAQLAAAEARADELAVAACMKAIEATIVVCDAHENDACPMEERDVDYASIARAAVNAVLTPEVPRG